MKGLIVKLFSWLGFTSRIEVIENSIERIDYLDIRLHKLEASSVNYRDPRIDELEDTVESLLNTITNLESKLNKPSIIERAVSIVSPKPTPPPRVVKPASRMTKVVGA